VLPAPYELIISFKRQGTDQELRIAMAMKVAEVSKKVTPLPQNYRGE
jgi:hypothetical protein